VQALRPHYPRKGSGGAGARVEVSTLVQDEELRCPGEDEEVCVCGGERRVSGARSLQVVRTPHKRQS
jgi:hypothetical protein